MNLLIESAVTDPPECQIPPFAVYCANGNAGQVAKVLKVEDKTFFVVKATTETLVLLKDYLIIVINLELVVTDVMLRIVEYLKVFALRDVRG